MTEIAVSEKPPLAYPAALRALTGCAVGAMLLLWQRRMHLPRQRVGMELRFADGTAARIFRETIVDREATQDPCVLVVAFRLRAVRGRGHALFQRESLLNTLLFVGFPRLCVQAVAGQRRTRPLPGPVRVGWI